MRRASLALVVSPALLVLAIAATQAEATTTLYEQLPPADCFVPVGCDYALSSTFGWGGA